MNGQQHGQFTLYAAEAAIPRYQRAWVWGLAALTILLCGLAAGWLLGGVGTGLRSGTTDVKALLAQRQAVHDELRTRIAELEQTLSGDPCHAATPKIPPPSR